MDGAYKRALTRTGVRTCVDNQALEGRGDVVDAGRAAGVTTVAGIADGAGDADGAGVAGRRARQADARQTG